MRRRSLILGLVFVVCTMAWYWFRPELLFLSAKVNEAPPDSGLDQQVILAQGSFHGVAHYGKGKATLYRLADGRPVLRLSDFETSNGPALYVYLIASEDARDSASIQDVDFIDLGKLKGNLGDQNYELPADIDLTPYRAVTIWCRRFRVNFATAPLALTPSAKQGSVRN